MNAEQKKPRLFYYEDAVGAYVPCPEKVENILELDSHFSDDGEEIEIRFKRFDMTDFELAQLPDC